MDSIFSSLCVMLQLGFGMPSNACNSAFTASYINTNMKKEIDDSQEYIKKRSYIIINDYKYEVYSLVFIGMGIDSYKKKQLQIITPFEPFINQISIDLKEDVKSVKLEWKYNF